jgi:hypothetical protein
MSKAVSITVEGKNINISQINHEDYICLTDMAKSQDESIVIIKWLSAKNTIEFLGAWESINNPDFNSTEYGIIRNEAGGNNYVLSVKKWIEATNAIGLVAKTGRYGGTYAHKDIAFEFGTWISPIFKLYLIKEFQRLKEQESGGNNLEWNVRRVLSKANYHLQTLAVKEYRIPNEGIPQDRQGYAYAEEADILNYAIFGYSAKAWRDANPELAQKGLNARDVASVNELAVLSSMESMNSVMIRSGMSKYERGIELRRIAQQQLRALNDVNIEKSYNKMLGIQSDDKPIRNSKPLPPLKAAKEIVERDLSPFDKALKKALDYNPKDKDKSTE